MGVFCTYLRNAILDHVFGKATLTSPTIYVCLSLADPGADGSGLSEPTAASYAPVETSASDWTVSSDGVISNATDLTFPSPTEDWGLVTHCALKDASGNVLSSDQLPGSTNILSGSTAPCFSAGSITVTQT